MSIEQRSLTVAIVVASLGRPGELSQLLDCLSKQTLAPVRIVLSLASVADAPPDITPGVDIIYGSAGSSAQRNRGLEAVQAEADVIAFIDDDYVPSRRFVETVANYFAGNSDVVGANGHLLADGIRKGGISFGEAKRLVDEYDQLEHEVQPEQRLPNGLYGCNMAYRASAIGDTRFDEALPLYGWQEDLDFSISVGKRGRLVKTNAFAGVHCGVTKARSPGLRLGYSQVANPIYLMRKGTMTASFAAELVLRNIAANHIRCLKPEPWVDRVGRLKGNWLAIRDLLLGSLRPDRILELKTK